MTTFHVFKSGLSSMRMVTPNGAVINFVAGEYVTSDERTANWLKKEIANGVPNIYQDVLDNERDAEKVDPLAAIKAALKEELIREMNQNMGIMPDSEKTALVPTSTADISAVSLAPTVNTNLAPTDAAKLMAILTTPPPLETE